MTKDTQNRQPIDKRQAILDYIEEFTAREGWPPTVREIGGRIGARSPSTVQRILDSLVKAGRLHRGGAARQLRVVKS